jgi:hypothetical protein
MSDSFDRLLARTERHDAAPPGHCPDAGVLAAYLDSTLAPAERSAVEAHAADCARCALQLATIARLEDESGHPQHAVRRWRPRWTWVVPAAAAVLVAGIYVALPGRAPSPAAPPPAEQAADRVASDEQGGAAPLAAAPSEGQLARRARAGTPSAAGTARKEPSTAAPAEIQVPEQQLRDEVQSDAFASTESRVARAAEMSAPAAPPAVTIDAAAKQVETGAGAADARVGAPLVIAAPGARVRWRVMGSRIERSTDGGRTWGAERAPSAAGVIMGTAPSEEVCWLVARSGQVLRRDPAGEWHDVTPFPRRDTARIESTGPAVATVIAPDGGAVTTVDGGQHWSPEPPR